MQVQLKEVLKSMLCSDMYSSHAAPNLNVQTNVTKQAFATCTCIQQDAQAYFPLLLANSCMTEQSVPGNVEYMCSKVLHPATHVAPVRNTDRLCLHGISV